MVDAIVDAIQQRCDCEGNFESGLVRNDCAGGIVKVGL
jgi:hypothetical protein